MTIETWLAFFLASWAISLSPGAGAVAAMGSGLRHGLRHGYWTTVGLQIGIVLQLAVVATGLGALLAASTFAFEAVRWFGVAYLLYLGIAQWRGAGALNVDAAREPGVRTRRALIVRGMLVNAANPKATIFMLAVLPQFVDPGRPLLAQYALITLTMVSVDLFVMGGYTLLAARLLPLLRTPRKARWIGRGFGAMFVLAALALATWRRGGAGH